MASQNLALRRHAGRSQQPTAAASGDVLNWFAVKRGTSDASHEVRSVVVTSLSWPCYHPRRARHGARGVDAAGCPRHPTTAASPSGTITDGPGRTSIAGPGRQPRRRPHRNAQHRGPPRNVTPNGVVMPADALLGLPHTWCCRPDIACLRLTTIDSTTMVVRFSARVGGFGEAFTEDDGFCRLLRAR